MEQTAAHLSPSVSMQGGSMLQIHLICVGKLKSPFIWMPAGSI